MYVSGYYDEVAIIGIPSPLNPCQLDNGSSAPQRLCGAGSRRHDFRVQTFKSFRLLIVSYVNQSYADVLYHAHACGGVILLSLEHISSVRNCNTHSKIW